MMARLGVLLLLCIAAAHACDFVGPTWIAQATVMVSGGSLTLDMAITFDDMGNIEWSTTTTPDPSSLCKSNTVTWEGTYDVQTSSQVYYDLTYCSADRAGCVYCLNPSEGVSPYSFSPDCSLLTLSNFNDDTVTLKASNGSPGGLSTGAIVGIIIGVLVFVGGLVTLVVVMRKRSYSTLA